VLAISLMMLNNNISPRAAAFLAFINLLTYALYAQDKSRARNKRRRTPELTLHLFSLLGGWPAALLAQFTLKHKNRKASFMRIYYVTAIVNVALGWWIFNTWPTISGRL